MRPFDWEKDDHKAQSWLDKWAEITDKYLAGEGELYDPVSDGFAYPADEKDDQTFLFTNSELVARNTIPPVTLFDQDRDCLCRPSTDEDECFLCQRCLDKLTETP